MAEKKRTTTADVVEKTMVSEHHDFVRDAVALITQGLMEAEISTEIRAIHDEVSAERDTKRLPTQRLSAGL